MIRGVDAYISLFDGKNIRKDADAFEIMWRGGVVAYSDGR